MVALRLARRLRPWFGVAKVGFELFGAAGPEAVSALTVEGYRVFVDLKLHDIPTTVGRAARVLGGLGAAFVTVHTQGGEDMMRAAVSGMAEGAAGGGSTNTLRARSHRSDERRRGHGRGAGLALEVGGGGRLWGARLCGRGSGRDAPVGPRAPHRGAGDPAVGGLEPTTRRAPRPPAPPSRPVPTFW